LVPQITGRISLSRPHKRGVSRSSRTLGAGCDGRLQRKRRVRWKRTAKSCGPGLSMPRSSWRRCLRIASATVAIKPITAESTKQAVKTIRAGNAGSFRRTCGDYARMLSLLHTRLRVRLTCPAFPAPSISDEGHDEAKPGQDMPREGDGVSRAFAWRTRGNTEANVKSTAPVIRGP